MRLIGGGPSPAALQRRTVPHALENELRRDVADNLQQRREEAGGEGKVHPQKNLG